MDRKTERTITLTSQNNTINSHKEVSLVTDPEKLKKLNLVQKTPKNTEKLDGNVINLQATNHYKLYQTSKEDGAKHTLNRQSEQHQ